MRVLQITAFAGWGCTGRIAQGINESLINEGGEGYIAWGRKNTSPKEINTIKIGNKVDQVLHGIYTRVTDKCGFGSKRVTSKFLKEVDKCNPDLIHLHIMHGYYINIEMLFKYIKQKNIPVVWTFHDCWAFTGHCPYFDYTNCEKWKTGCKNCIQKNKHPKSYIKENSKYNWEKKKELFTGVENMTIVTPSKWLGNLVKESFLKEYEVKVINNGINIDLFKYSESNFKKIYNLENKKILLGVSSTWVKSKGIDDFIELSKVLDENYKIVLVGLSKKQIKILPTNILGIEKTDNIEQLVSIYSAADVFLNLTYEDNYPTTNLEALSCGTRVITYNTGGSVEAVKNDNCGYIVEKGDIHGVKSKIIELCKLERMKKSLFECSEIKNNLQYVELYKQILGGN